MRSLYYRYCWHRVSNLLFLWYSHRSSSHRKAVYNPKAFIPHAASLRQAFAHCAIFPTAASRRSWARVSVPMWLIILMRPATRHRLGGLLPRQLADRIQALPRAHCCFTLAGPSGINPSFDGLSLTWGEIPIHYSLVRHSDRKMSYSSRQALQSNPK